MSVFKIFPIYGEYFGATFITEQGAFLIEITTKDVDEARKVVYSNYCYEYT